MRNGDVRTSLYTTHQHPTHPIPIRRHTWTLPETEKRYDAEGEKGAGHWDWMFSYDVNIETCSFGLVWCLGGCESVREVPKGKEHEEFRKALRGCIIPQNERKHEPIDIGGIAGGTKCMAIIRSFWHCTEHFNIAMNEDVNSLLTYSRGYCLSWLADCRLCACVCHLGVCVCVCLWVCCDCHRCQLYQTVYCSS